MDRELIASLSNLSFALEKVAESLADKSKLTSNAGSVLQKGEFDKQIREISNSITEVRRDNRKILDQQNTILKILESKDKKNSNPNNTVSKKINTNTNTTQELSKEDKSSLFKGLDTSKVKDGVATVLTIALGIVAIGLALKVVGKVDFVSVMTLALALPLIAISFSKIFSVFSGDIVEHDGKKIKMSKFSVRDLPSVIFSIVGFSTAIMLSSHILSKVKPIGISQAFTSVMISGVFALISPNFSKFIDGVGNIGMLNFAKSMVFLPLALISISSAIMLSSEILSRVKPIGISQAFSSIMIAGVFSVISYGIGKLLGSFKGINPATALATSLLLPIVLYSVSYSIMKSSELLSRVKPIGLFQAITSILIAGTFAVISYGIGNILSGFKGVDVASALIATAIMPLVLISLSYSIMKSSEYLRKVSPIGLFQAITSILIAATFVVLSYSVAKIIPSFKGINPLDALKMAAIMPIIFTSMSIAIMASSYALSIVRPISPSQFLSAIGISILFVGISYSISPIVKALSGVSEKDIATSFLKLSIGIVAISIASFIINKIPDISMSKTLKLVAFTGGLLAMSYLFGGIFKVLNKIEPNSILKGGFALVSIATVIMASSIILSKGDYTKYPNWKWSLFSTLSLGIFAIGVSLLGTQASNPMFYDGMGVVILLSGVVVATSHILGLGNYKDYPSWKWSIGVGLSLSMFGLGAVLLGTQVLNPLFYAGLGMILVVAGTLVATSYILRKGVYTTKLSKDWVNSSLLLIGKFSLVAAAIGIISPLLLLGIPATLGIAGTILIIDTIFNRGKFKYYPSDTWIKGVSNTFISFSEMMGKINILDALTGVVKLSLFAVSIKKVDDVLNNGKFINYPNKNWVDGVTYGISKFLNISKNFSIFGAISDKIKDGFGGGIVGMVKNILDVDKILSKGSFKKFPSLDWTNSVLKTLLLFDSFNSKISVLGNIFGGIIGVSKNILKVANILSLGNYSKYPNSVWVSGVVSSILSFGKILSYYDKNFSIVGIKSAQYKINKVSDIILSIDSRFSKASFNNYPTKEWLNNIYSSIFATGNIISNIDSSFGILDITSGVYKLNKISDSISRVSILLSKGNYSKYPTLDWSKSISSILNGFSNLNIDYNVDNSVLNKIADDMLFMDSKFKSGSWQKFPSVEWANGSLSAVQKFKSILSILSFDSIGDVMSKFGFKSGIKSTLTNIEIMAKSFDKLSKSIKSFSDSIKAIDADKISQIRSLSTSVVMMSLMDPGQFDAMMDKLEKRSGVFNDLITDFDKKKSDASNTGITFKTNSNSKDKTNDIKTLSDKMDLTNALLADISSVVGGKGSLKNYLNRTKEDLTIGNNSGLNQRSDKRLKSIIEKKGVSNYGINIYLFTYLFDPKTIYQGIIAQELIGTKYESALHIDNRGYYSVDYSIIDVEFKKINNSR